LRVAAQAVIVMQVAAAQADYYLVLECQLLQALHIQ
jgi:hypothetical protein